MRYYIKLTPEQIEMERKRREKSCKTIKLLTIKIPAILAVVFILWMFVAGGSSAGVPAIIVTVVLGIPWALFWNWIADMERK